MANNDFTINPNYILNPGFDLKPNIFQPIDIYTEQNNWQKNNLIPNVLSYPSPLTSSNSEGFGVAYADDISGHRVVANLTTLFNIPDAILSKSGTNLNNDAIGQIWFVTSRNVHYKLKDWDLRKTLEGWEIFKPALSSDINKKINFQSFKDDSLLILADSNNLPIISSDDKLFTFINEEATGPITKTVCTFDINNETSSILNILFSDAFNLSYNENKLIINLNAGYIFNTAVDDGYNFFKVPYNSDSDIRFKQNIQHINKGILDKLMQIDIISYKWNKPDEIPRNTFGVSSKQIKELGGIFEKIVHHRKDELKTEWVEYDRFGVLAIAGIKELERKRKADKRELLKKIDKQQTEIEELIRENTLMQRKIKWLENKLNNLELVIKKLG